MCSLRYPLLMNSFAQGVSSDLLSVDDGDFSGSTGGSSFFPGGMKDFEGFTVEVGGIVTSDLFSGDVSFDIAGDLGMDFIVGNLGSFIVSIP